MTQRRWMLSTTEIDRIVISGAGEATVNGTLLRVDDVNNRVFYAGEDREVKWSKSPARWEIYSAGTLQYTSTDDVMSPLQVTTWALAAGSNPLPTIAVDTTNTYTTEVFPANTADVKYSWERNLDAGQIFFRKKLSVDLVFGGRDRGADYDRFWRARKSTPCASTYIRQEQKEGGIWRVVWTGVFSAAQMRFDLDRCTCSVRPDTVDRYSCILRSLDRKENALKAAVVDAQLAVVFPLEFSACYFENFAGETACAALHSPITTYYTQLDDVGYGVGLVRLYGRRRETTTCVDGSPVPPPGTGWVLLENNCAVDGTAVYVKALTGGEVFDLNISAVVGTCTDGVPSPPSDGCRAYVLVSGCEDFDPPIYACLGGLEFAVAGARTLRSVMELLLRRSECPFTPNLQSDFLEWDAPGDTPGYAAGVNYVTGTTNQYNNLLLVQNSDAIDPAASNPATRGDITLGQCLELLNKSMRLFWDLDADGNMRIEHWSAWQFQQGLDTQAQEGVEPLAFAPSSGGLPRFERCTWQASQAQDFLGADIEYTSACVPEDAGSKDYGLGYFITDITYIESEPDAISKDGFTVMACTLEAGTYSVIIDQGAITGNYITNAPMAWANLHRDLWQHDRFLPSAILNNEPATFPDFLPNVEQEKVVVLCLDILKWDPRDTVASALGARVGANGTVSKAEWSDRANALELTLRYPFL